MSNLREALEAVRQDVETSPDWLKNIYETNRRIRKFIDLRDSQKLESCEEDSDE
jgi:hypothetical protein